MKLDIYGNKRAGFSAHGDCEECDLARLLPCPFCGSSDLEITNTHTPCYWVECQECLSQANGESTATSGRLKSKDEARKLHAEALDSAVFAWNRRPTSRLTGCIRDLFGSLEDIMPQIGNLAIQDFEQLNRGLAEARRILAKS